MALAEYGIESAVVEKEPRLGGKASLLNCKAVDGVCQVCGACLAGKKIEAVGQQELIKVLVSAEVVGARDLGHGFEVDVKTPEGNTVLFASGIIVAVGIDTFPSRLRPEFGYCHLPGVITALELEGILKESPEILGENPRMAFVQCFGSRERSGVGVPYCSRVCCLYVPKLARKVRAEVSGSCVDLYLIDRQRYETLYRAQTSFCDEIRAMPSKVYLEPGGQLAVVYDDPETRKPKTRRYDWVVLCPALIPGTDAPSLAVLLGLGVSQDGFLRTGERGSGKRRRVLTAGACTGPMSIVESIASGRAAAGQMLNELNFINR